MSKSSHSHERPAGKNLLITIFLNIAITAAQVVGGVISGSMALLSDAAHNFSDVLSLIISYWAIKLSGREQTLRETYGYKRAEIFAALINASILLVIAVGLISEAIVRLINPSPVKGSVVIWLALMGVLLNGLSLLFIKKDASGNMNIRSAYLHLFTDMLTSVAVLIGGIVISYLGWLRVDSVLTILISAWLLYTSWGIFYQSVRIFMQFTPANIDIEDIAGKITSISGIRNIHHVHVWQLDDHEMILEAHIDMEADYTISHFEVVLEKVEAVLREAGINHSNIQPELHREDLKDLINKSTR